MRKVIKEIRLKKDTPDHKAGELFVLMSNNGIYEIDAGEDDPSVFYGGDIKNFDEWFEPVPDKWPQKDDAFWSVSSDGTSFLDSWHNYADGRRKMAIGNAFKTREAADQFVDYLKAVETVRHDEGFMKISRKNDCSSHGYGILRYYLNGSVISEEIDDAVCAGEFYFDTAEHAKASLEKHPDEWKTILDYDWSKGEDEEDED